MKTKAEINREVFEAPLELTGDEQFALAEWASAHARNPETLNTLMGRAKCLLIAQRVRADRIKRYEAAYAAEGLSLKAGR